MVSCYAHVFVLLSTGIVTLPCVGGTFAAVREAAGCHGAVWLSERHQFSAAGRSPVLRIAGAIASLQTACVACRAGQSKTVHVKWKLERWGTVSK